MSTDAESKADDVNDPKLAETKEDDVVDEEEACLNYRAEIRDLEAKLLMHEKGGNGSEEFLDLVTAINGAMSDWQLAVDIAQGIPLRKKEKKSEFSIPEIQGMTSELDKLSLELKYWDKVAGSD